MAIDIETQVLIHRPRSEVAAFAMDPDNDPLWIGGIKEARRLTDGPLGVGARVQRVAAFLGRRIEYINEVTEYDAQARLVMRSIKGPFPMVLHYEFEETDPGTIARIRVQGEATGFFKLAAPALSGMVKRSVTNDLKALRDLLEARAAQPA